MGIATGSRRMQVIREVLAEHPYLGDVLVRLATELREIQEAYRRQGRRLEELGDPQRLVRQMVAAVPSPSPWNELLGPFYDTSQVARLLGTVSRQAVADRRRRRTILALRTRDGAWVYPAFQFDARNRLLSGLSEPLRAFASYDADGWTVAAWLVSPRRELDGRSAIEWLRAGRATEPVVILARDAALRLAA